MNPPELSVIIPTYSRVDVLRRMLNLLATQTLPAKDFEVIVVDDGSTDETPRLLDEWQKNGQLRLTTIHQENSGQGAARNRALDVARGRIVVFLGDDMLPSPTTLIEHFRFHVLHPSDEAACLGLVTWHPDAAPTRFMRWLERSGVQFKFDDLARDESVDFFRFYTSNISLKRAFIGSDRFDMRFKGWGWEDTELGLRLAQRGMQLIYWPDAVVAHLHHISDIDLERRQYSSGKNAALFQALHPDVRILPRGVKKLGQYIIAYLLPFTYWSRAKRAFLRGVRDGLRV